MADYYPLIAKAVSGLDKSTVEARRALYDRARTALLAQLHGVEPTLGERERWALEEAIKKVEADATRRSRGEPLLPAHPEARADGPVEPQQDAADPVPRFDTRTVRSVVAATMPDDGNDQSDVEETRPAIALSAAAAAAKPAGDVRPVDEPRIQARPADDSEALRAERWSPGSSLSDNGLRRFRNGIAETGSPEGVEAQRNGRAYQTTPPDFGNWTEQAPDTDAGLSQPAEHPLPRHSSRDIPRPPTPPALPTRPDDTRVRAQSFPRVVRPERVQAQEHAPEQPAASTWSVPLNSNKVVAIAVILLLVLALAGVVYWLSDDIMASIRGVSGRTADQTVPAESNTRGKIAERAPSAPTASESALATQKVVLYEEDQANPNGTQFVGAAVWRTERVAPAPGQKPDIVIRADIEIPEQKVQVRLSLRRNDDKQLPASHTVEIVFTLPPDFSHGGIANIPGIMMKQGETTRGVALNGVAVKVTANFFLVGLSSVDADMQRNVQLLKERSWFDIPVVYGDGKRALIAIEKGIPGERAFMEAFATWEQ